MKTIGSRDNPIYKKARKLLKRKYRDAYGLYLLEGIKPLRDAISLGIEIEEIFVCDGEMDISAPKDSGYDFTILDRELFKMLTDTEHSQGVISVVKKVKCGVDSLEEMKNCGSGNLVILDRLQDPGNVGTVIRTAEAAGYSGVVTVTGCADVYSPKVVRAAAGSLFRVPVIDGGDQEMLIPELKKYGFKIAATSLDGDTLYRDADISESTALVIGNEGNGVGNEFLEAADLKIKIPMMGSIESLNAAVAAGILMYQSNKIK